MEDDPEKLYDAACWSLALIASLNSLWVVMLVGNLTISGVAQISVWIKSIL